MRTTVIGSDAIRSNILIPKYYTNRTNPTWADARGLRLVNLGKLIDDGVVSVRNGDEPGKMAYGTGDIPFVRTSDISNWEIKTVPKQGVSEEVYAKYASKEDVRAGDILLVKDGTYLIGTSCIVTPLDTPMLFQSHIVKFRVDKPEVISTEMLFLALNTPFVDQQLRSFQFTADIIDTIGTRYREVMLPVPKDDDVKADMEHRVKSILDSRTELRTVVKQFPLLVSESLEKGSLEPFDEFDGLGFLDKMDALVSDTSTLEFGRGSHYVMDSDDVVDNILIPKYYDPAIEDDLGGLSETCQLMAIHELVDQGVISLSTGDEPGKMTYGTGDIPFVRTSDFANWEIKHDPKQSVSEDVYRRYAAREDVRANDILLVRDGTYLVGSSCMVTPQDERMLYCGGLIKLRATDTGALDPYVLFALLNAYIVKRQIRSKQFTRDVIDTIGNRLPEVVLPIPRDHGFAEELSDRVKSIVVGRIAGRAELRRLADELAPRF